MHLEMAENKEQQVRKLLEQFLCECASRSDLEDWKRFNKDRQALLDKYTKCFAEEVYDTPLLNQPQEQIP